ncbi:predicted protein [Naegleria gruberi]|uniref:Predicted protein n=1 Tax=Naegleria gruberi TaxID=5762 RepID=D2VED2_NAEGR|nr:uncharacterized protein NAEGRDRAFT_67237 [Naegleria gruberi]EFC44778.1 predicted protein [Naegleria gruberi]|eukprot:XP_002677522.1 predicted protein [Naegleria gruberi strain NEG-M]
MLTSPREEFADSGDEDDKDVIDQFKKLIRLSRNSKQNHRNFAKTEISNNMNFGKNNTTSEKEEKVSGIANMVMKRLMMGKFVTQVRPHFLSAVLYSDESREDDCSSVANVLYSRLVDSISKTSRSQTIVLNGKTTRKRVKTTLTLLNLLLGAKGSASIASEQLSLFYRFGSTSLEHGEYLKPLFAFNIGITFKTEKGSSQLSALDFDVAASLFNRFEIEYLLEKKSPYQTAVQCIVERIEIFKDLLCAPSKMLEPLLGQTFVELKYFAFINNLKKEVPMSESRFYDFLKNIKRALLCSTREINTLLRTLSIILLLLDLEDNTSSDAFNEAIKSEIESHLETFDSELLGQICEILHMEQFEVLKSVGMMIDNKREELGFAFTKCTSFVCILVESLFRWIGQKCKKASKDFVNSIEIDENLECENIAAVHIISFPELSAEKNIIYSFGDLWCNASSEHAYSWALQFLVEDISTTHTKEGFVTDPLIDILEGSSSREIIDFLFGNTGLLCSYPSLSDTSTYHDRKDAIDKVIFFFRNNSYYGLSSVNMDQNDGNHYMINHSFGKFKYEVGSFFPKYINEDVQHQILKAGIPSVEISDLHKDFLHSMKSLFSPTALNSDPTFVTFFHLKTNTSTNDLMQQMINSQVMTVSDVCEKSFDVTLSKKSFWKVFHPLSYKKFSKDTALDLAVSKILLHSIGFQKSGQTQFYFIGKSSVMLKRDTYETLRAHVFDVMNEAATVIQKLWRRYKLKKKLRESIKEAIENNRKEIKKKPSPQKIEIPNEEVLFSKPKMAVSTTPLSEKKKKLQKSYAYGLVKRKEAIKKRAASPMKKPKPQKVEKVDIDTQVSVIQALIRGKLATRHMSKKVDLSLKIQRLYREKKRNDIEREIRKRKINVIKKRNEQKKHEIEKLNVAARKIQQAWVNYKENYFQKQLIEAVIIIQRAWRAYKLKRSLKILLKIRRDGERRKKEYEERERRLKDKEMQVVRETKELEYQKHILEEKEKLFVKQHIVDKKLKEKEEQVWNSLQEISNSLIHSNRTQLPLSSPPQPPSKISNLPLLPSSQPKRQLDDSSKVATKMRESSVRTKTNITNVSNNSEDNSSSNKKISYADLLKEAYGSAFESKIKPKPPSLKKVNKTESEIDKSKIASPRKVTTNSQNKSTIITNIPTSRVVPKQPILERQTLNTSKYHPSTIIVPEKAMKQMIERNEKKSKKPNETWNQWNLLVQELSNEFNP